MPKNFDGRLAKRSAVCDKTGNDSFKQDFLAVFGFILICLIWLVSGFFNGLTSFGGNLLAIPILMFLVSPTEAIFQGYACGAAIGLALALIYWRHILWKEFLVITAINFCGIPAGILFLKYVPIQYIFLLAGLTLVAFLAWQFILAKLHMHLPQAGKFWVLPLAFFTGFLNGAIGMGGPPMAIYVFLRKWTAKHVLGTMSLSGFFNLAAIVPIQFLDMDFSFDILKTSLICSLFAAVGIFLSIPVISRMNIRLFRAFLLVIIALGACNLLFRWFNY